MASHDQYYKAGEATGRAEERGNRVGETMGDKARHAKDKTYDTAQHAKDKTAEKAHEAKDRTAETAHEGKEKTKGVLQETGDKMKHMAQKTGETVKSAFGMAHHDEDDKEKVTGHEHHTTTYKETKF
ncbi:late embryogenesis abundant protein D-7 [Mercurialis annua]|uniref:late embryogenesis abundant protein D-7 n=1 Tax=Mercurialis annua TaxID=3986 RepID=UPI0021607898|nr:late embryogenesis abundant protein D-7 [Mercurialis annua]